MVNDSINAGYGYLALFAFKQPFSALHYIVLTNQAKFFENAKQCSKRMRKWDVATQLSKWDIFTRMLNHFSSTCLTFHLFSSWQKIDLAVDFRCQFFTKSCNLKEKFWKNTLRITIFPISCFLSTATSHSTIKKMTKYLTHTVSYAVVLDATVDKFDKMPEALWIQISI